MEAHDPCYRCGAPRSVHFPGRPPIPPITQGWSARPYCCNDFQERPGLLRLSLAYLALGGLIALVATALLAALPLTLGGGWGSMWPLAPVVFAVAFVFGLLVVTGYEL